MKKREVVTIFQSILSLFDSESCNCDSLKYVWMVDLFSSNIAPDFIGLSIDATEHCDCSKKVEPLPIQSKVKYEQVHSLM